MRCTGTPFSCDYEGYDITSFNPNYVLILHLLKNQLFYFFLFHFRCLTRWACSTKVIMQNDAGEFVDLLIPRKCSASNRIIGAKDHASIQINIAEVDETTGRMTGGYKTYAICGAIRRMGESDDSLIRLAKRDGIITKNF
ncbi:40S ribosomal protein S21 [Bulinus truncatus]|nr:40S ribosomal protein S21 [Bulinus truncatus]